jgi:hypothetical protein
MRTILILAFLVFLANSHAQEIFQLTQVIYPGGRVMKIVVSGDDISLFEGNVSDVRNLDRINLSKLTIHQQKHIQKIISALPRGNFKPKESAEFPESDGVLDGNLWYFELHHDDKIVAFWDRGTKLSVLFKYITDILVTEE